MVTHPHDADADADAHAAPASAAAPATSSGRGPGSASVARSLAAAAAALRASEWRGGPSRSQAAAPSSSSGRAYAASRQPQPQAPGGPRGRYADWREEKQEEDAPYEYPPNQAAARGQYPQRFDRAADGFFSPQSLEPEPFDQLERLGHSHAFSQAAAAVRGHGARDHNYDRNFDYSQFRPQAAYYDDAAARPGEDAWAASSWQPPASSHRRYRSQRAALAAAAEAAAQDTTSHSNSSSVSSGDFPPPARRPQPHPVAGAATAPSGQYRPAARPPPPTQLVTALAPRHSPPAAVRTNSQAAAGPRGRAAAPVPAAGAGAASTTSSSASSASAKKPSNSATGISASTAEADAEGEGKAPTAAEAAADDAKKPKKRVRYLRDTDRRNIIKRIENGEKQAALAREFGVTRAAICHIKKNRFEILSRYNLLVKSAQEMDRAENFSGPPGVEMMVHEIRANSVLLLLTMLRDSRSGAATFRRAAGRLIMILLEEALAILGTQAVEVITGTGHLYRGLERQHDFCGVAMGAEGFPFLVLFQQMEPSAPQGSIYVEMTTDRQGNQMWHLDHMDLPANITEYKILLFSASCGSGDGECKAIEALCSVGAQESSISLVVILSAADGLVTIGNHFPHVKIITGAIDGKVDRQTQTVIPGFGDFVSRYNGP